MSITNDEIFWNYFKEKGLTEYGIAGLYGNIQCESGFNPIALEKLCINRIKEATGITYTGESYTKAVDSGKITREEFLKPLGKQYGFGLCQLTSPNRKAGLYDLAKKRGISIGNFSLQCDYLYYELNNSYLSVLTVLKSAKSIKEASDIVLIKFERPASITETTKKKRCDVGQDYYNKYKGVNNMNIIDKLIATAEAEVGYIEKASNKDLDNKTKNPGNANYTKYGRDMHKLYPSVMDFPASWCDCFIDWCFYKTFGVDNAKKLLCGDFNDYTVTSAQLYKNAKRFYTSPRKGDQIFFNNGTRICHTGIVYKVDSKKVYTIEGNTSSETGVVENGGCVRKKAYDLNYIKISGYGRPDYDKYGIVKNDKPIPTIKLDVAKYFSKSFNKTYTTTSNLNLRIGAGTDKNIILTIPAKKTVRCYGYYNINNKTNWYYVVYDNNKGYISSKYLN